LIDHSKGHTETWIGYKLHIDTIDGQLPISCVLTSASTHDSQVALPLAEISVQRVTNLYDLMDSAYNAPAIKDKSIELGHVPIIDVNPRRNKALRN
jgi:K+-transporting ATPase c subunit